MSTKEKLMTAGGRVRRPLGRIRKRTPTGREESAGLAENLET